MKTFRESADFFLAHLYGKQDPADVALVRRMADIRDEVRTTKVLSPEQLDVITEGARHRLTMVNSSANQALKWLQHEGYVIDEAIRTLASNKSATVRFTAYHCICSSTSAKLADELLIAGLKDRSGNVRWLSAEKANRLRKRWLVPLIAETLKSEKPGRAADAIAFELALLRDGYILKPNDDRYSLTYLTRGGFCDEIIDKSVIDAEGPEKIIAERLAERDAKGLDSNYPPIPPIENERTS